MMKTKFFKIEILNGSPLETTTRPVYYQNYSEMPSLSSMKDRNIEFKIGIKLRIQVGK